MPASYINVGGELLANAILVRTEVVQELNEHDWCWIEARQTEDVRMDIEEMLGKDLKVTTHDEDGAQRIIFDGFVLETEIHYEIYGSYTARLTAVSRSYKLDCTHQESYWRKKKLQDVAMALASEDGLTAAVKCEAKPARNYVQWGETDFAFLKRMADDHQAWIRPTSQGIEISDKFQPGTLLQWRTEEGLLSFSVKGRLSQPVFQGTHHNVRSMESSTLRGVKKRADFTGASDRMVNAVHRGSESLPPGHVVTDGRSGTEGEFREMLERESMRSVAGSVMGHGMSRVERLRAGDTVQIQGVLDAKGTYGVVKVVHRWDPKGYTNEFWCTPWTKYVSPVRPVAPHITGVVTARVKDHNDPRHMGRLQVQYDWLEDGATGWARMATPHAGADRGFLFLPEIGDEVLVAFENGDPERPFILGSLWNGIDKAPRQEFWGGDVAPNDIKRIVTKSGHRIQFSDKEGKEAIVIATPSKLKFSLIEKTDETGRPMILIHAADGDLVFSAPNGRIHLHSQYLSREIGSGDRGALQQDRLSGGEPLTHRAARRHSMTASVASPPASKSSFDVFKSDEPVVVPHIVEQYSDGITMVGSPEYRKKVREHLDTLKRTRTGQEVIDRLNQQGKKGKGVWIRSGPPGNAKTIARSVACRPKKASVDRKTGKVMVLEPGDGVASDVSFNADWEPRYPNGKSCLPPDGVLCHELIHALHNGDGMNLNHYTDNSDQARSPRGLESSNHEEAQTIGRGAYVSGAPTENSYRREKKGLLARPTHFGGVCP